MGGFEGFFQRTVPVGLGCIYYIADLEGPVDPKLLEHALRQCVKRHPNLRARLTDRYVPHTQQGCMKVQHARVRESHVVEIVRTQQTLLKWSTCCRGWAVRRRGELKGARVRVWIGRPLVHTFHGFTPRVSSSPPFAHVQVHGEHPVRGVPAHPRAPRAHQGRGGLHRCEQRDAVLHDRYRTYESCRLVTTTLCRNDNQSISHIMSLGMHRQW